MHEQEPGLLSAIRHVRFAILLVALMAMIVSGPALEFAASKLSPATTQIVLLIVFSWMTISAAFAVSTHRRTPLVAVVLAVLLLLASVCELTTGWFQTRLLSNSLAVVFLAYIVIVLMRFIINRKRVNANTLFASLCVYLLLGFLWASAYAVLEQARPGGFSYAHSDDQSMLLGAQGASQALYFSFVTMTTVGYGEITPVSASARALVMLQAICGQFYLTALVAWLVGLHVADTYRGNSKPEDTDTATKSRRQEP